MRIPWPTSQAVFVPVALFWGVIIAVLWFDPRTVVTVEARAGLILMIALCCAGVIGIRSQQKRDLSGWGSAANGDGDRSAPASQLHATSWWRRAIGAAPPTAAQKVLFGDRLILAPAGAPFGVVKRGRVFIAKNGSVKQVEGARAWLPCVCACGSRAVRYCARCGKEQPPRRGGS